MRTFTFSVNGSIFWLLWHIQIVSVITLALWGHYEVKSGWLERKHCDTETPDLITEKATAWLTWAVYTAAIRLAKGWFVSQVQHGAGCGGGRWHEIPSHTQNGTLFKTSKFSFGTSHLMLSDLDDCSWLQSIVVDSGWLKSQKMKVWIRRGLLYFKMVWMLKTGEFLGFI